MTRVQAKENLVTIGITEPTEEQVTNYLNQMASETKREKDRADKYKADADLKADLQKQLDDLNNQNLSDIEKANKATEDANNKIGELEKKLARMEHLNKLAEKGIVGEQAEKLISEDGIIDFEVLSQIISDREKAAATAKEQEIANSQGNPGGGSADDNTTPQDVKNAKTITFGGVQSDAQSVKDYYK